LGYNRGFPDLSASYLVEFAGQRRRQENAALLSESELTQIYREHTGPLYQYVSRRVGGDRTLAEDIVQDAWLRAVASWPHRETPNHPRAWLMRVAHNKSREDNVAQAGGAAVSSNSDPAIGVATGTTIPRNGHLRRLFVSSRRPVASQQ